LLIAGQLFFASRTWVRRRDEARIRLLPEAATATDD
jgi:hypothetical protein